MNPKVKLILVIIIPLIGISLWIFSLFKLLTPADVTGSDQLIDTGSQTTVQLPTGTNTILGSGRNTTGGVSTGIQVSKPLVEKTLTIAMPIWLYNEPGRRPLINKLAQRSIRIQMITNQWDQPYNEFVSGLISSGATGADIILVRDDQLGSISEHAGSFGFSQDISSLFPYLFFEYFKRTDYTYVPFGIDPMVTFMKNPIEQNTQSIDRSDIVNSATTQTQDIDPRKLAVQLPILFGISSLDLQLIKHHKEIYPGYTDVLKSLVYQSSNRSELIETIKAFSDDRLEEYKLRDLAKYKRILSKLIDRDPKCKTYPTLCFIHYKLTNIAFGYLSERDIVNGYFEQSNYQVYNFPNSSSVYPVRLWGWIVNNNVYDQVIKPTNDDISVAGVFFQEYVTQATNGNHYLRPTVFSAFNSVLASQESDLQRKYVSSFKSKRQVNPIRLETDTQREQFVALLKGEYDISVFLAGLR
ncbi:MAG TPA: hypothetical protein PK048_03150 [Candidatus Absconditabacterales bacterium]|nr:hypothetical protein [Candidatus Absconditabacterales bacterium]